MREKSGCKYEIHKGMVTLKSCPVNTSGEAVVPPEIVGLPVAHLGSGLLWGTGAVSLTLPDSIASVSPSLLSGCYSLRKLRITENGGGERFYRSLKTAIGERTIAITGGQRTFSLLLTPEDKIICTIKWLKGIDTPFPMQCMEQYYNHRTVYVLEYAAAQDDAAALSAAQGIKPFTLKQTDRLIDAAKDANAGEALAMLLDYKEKHFGFSDVFSALSREFTADPFSPAQIKKRFSIKVQGETCAVSGYLGGDRDIFIPERMGKRPITSLCARAFSPKKGKGARPIYDELKSVELGGVDEIGAGCFSGCSSLEAVSAPNVKSIPESCFLGCSSLRSFDFSQIDSIGAHAFENCTSLKSACLSNVTEMGEWAFYGCSDLSDIALPTESTLPELCFARCSGLKNIHFPDGIISTGKRSFFECTALEDISFAPGVRRIDWQSFSGCSGIKRLVIPGSVKEIGNLSFYYCVALTDLTLSEGIESIEWGAFSNCQTLESVRLPRSIRHIESYAFSECYALKEIHIPPEITQIDPMVFSDCRLVRIYGKRDSYAREYAWIYGIPFLEEKE